MWIERVIALGCVICAAFILGLIVAHAYGHRKNKSMREELQRLRNWKESTKVMCDKLHDGNDEDTKTGELEIKKVTQGHPNDA